MSQIMICVACGDSMCSQTAFDLFAMGQSSAPHTTALFIETGNYKAEALNHGIETGLRIGCDAILFVDADMEFPFDTLTRLLAHDQAIVGADYRRRKPPYDKCGQPVDGNPDSDSGLAERRCLGGGLILVRRTVFEAMRQPWFECKYENGRYFGEDVLFCDRARALGFKVWCDIDLTKQVFHIGQASIRWAEQT